MQGEQGKRLRFWIIGILMFLLYGGYYILVFHLKQILAGIGVFLLRNLLL